MKKSLLALAALAALSLVFVSCGGGGADPDKPESPNVTPAGGDTPTEVVVFDPATVESVSAGEIVDVEGTKYWKVTVDGYNTSIKITEVDCAGMSKVKAIAYGEVANDNAKLVVKLADSSYGDVALPEFSPIAVEPSDISVDFKGDARKIAVIQPFVQSTADWSALSNVVVYIGKIVATK